MTASDNHSRQPHIPEWALLVTVFITGACVLIIELMGTRILAPFFGSGIYTWSALIAITLAALALGYSFGGRLADRLPRADIMFNLCFAAGLWTLSTPMLARPLLPMMIQLADMRLGVLLTSCILYFPNLFLLGAIGPFVIRLLTHQYDRAGSVSGRVFAVSTVGSLVGALATGFVLIPNYGVQAIFAFCGTTLLAVAILGNFRPRFIGYALLLISLVVSLMLVESKRSGPKTSVEILEQTSSFYGQLQVIRRHDEKSLLLDGIGQNYVFDNDLYTTQYINFIAALPELRQSPASSSNRALVIGLGAGQLPMLLQRNGFHVDTVEIDPKVGELAARYFDFKLPPDQVHYMDGRTFLLRSKNFYEYIVIDAFSGEQLASHLLSVEALTETGKRLTETGALVINITSTTSGKDIAAIQHTLRTVFAEVRSFSIADGNELASIVFVASALPIQLTTTGASLADAQLADAKRFITGELADLDSDVLLTDDYNPVAYQRRQVQLLWRDAMIDYLGTENLDSLMF